MWITLIFDAIVEALGAWWAYIRDPPLKTDRRKGPRPRP